MCDACRTTWTQFLVLGRWSPGCPQCSPATTAAPLPGQPAAATTSEEPGYGGDILEDLKAAGVNVWKYGGATLEAAADATDAGSVARHDPQAVERIAEWIRVNWQEPRARRYPPRDWLYLYGTGSSRSGRDVRLGKLGNGKTFLAIATARELIERGFLSPRRFRFATAEQILLESEATFRSSSEESESNLLRKYSDPDLLVVDDLGVREMSAHAIRLFDELTKRREARATIWTSNLNLEVLAAGAEYLRRIADRVVGECGDGGRFVVPFDGPSRRLARSVRAAS